MFELPGTCRVETALLDAVSECQVSLAIALMNANLAEVVFLVVNQYAEALMFLCHQGEDVSPVSGGVMCPADDPLSVWA
jgi:hypothetical protein